MASANFSTSDRLSHRSNARSGANLDASEYQREMPAPFDYFGTDSISFKQSQTDHGSCDDTQCPRWNTGTGRKLSKTCRTSRKYIKYSDFGRRKKVLRGHEAHGNFHNGFRCDRHESLCWMVQFRPADDQPPLSGPGGLSLMGASLRF